MATGKVSFIYGYKIVEKIYSAKNNSSVYRVECKNGKPFIMKVYSVDDKKVDGDILEFDISSRLIHDNIMRAKDIFFNQKWYAMVMEVGIPLDCYLSDYHLTDDIKLYLMYGILRGLSFLKQNRIAHLDIKHTNILIIDGVVKIIDFDAADITDIDTTIDAHRHPEYYYNCFEIDRTTHGTASDILMTSHIFIDILNLGVSTSKAGKDSSKAFTTNFYDEKKQGYAHKLYHETFLSKRTINNMPFLNESAGAADQKLVIDLLFKMTEPDYKKRATADELLVHPLFTKIHSLYQKKNTFSIDIKGSSMSFAPQKTKEGVLSPTKESMKALSSSNKYSGHHIEMLRTWCIASGSRLRTLFMAIDIYYRAIEMLTSKDKLSVVDTPLQDEYLVACLLIATKTYSEYTNLDQLVAITNLKLRDGDPLKETFGVNKINNKAVTEYEHKIITHLKAIVVHETPFDKFKSVNEADKFIAQLKNNPIVYFS